MLYDTQRITSPPPPPFASGPPPEYQEFDGALLADNVDTPAGAPHVDALPPPPPPSPRISPSPMPPPPPLRPRPRLSVTPDAGPSRYSVAMPSAVVNDVILRWDADPPLEPATRLTRAATSPWQQPTVRATSAEPPSRRSTRAEYEYEYRPFIPLGPSPPPPPTVYTFTQPSYSTMTVIPTSSRADSGQPTYHVSVKMDCLRPSLHTTVLRHGGSENGPVVGFFRVGLKPSASDIVSLEGQTKPMRMPTLYKQVLQESSSGLRRSRVLWNWSFESVGLEWDVTDPRQKTCTLVSHNAGAPTDTIATFVAADEMQVALDGTMPPAKLAVAVGGHPVLDHIVFTALLLQRERFDPSGNAA